jgi:metal-sulfur cluster biosynthetic enzyme
MPRKKASKSVGKSTSKKTKKAPIKIHPIEKALMEAYLSDQKLADDEVKVEEVKIERPSLKIPGVRKEDGSECCGGGCCFEPADKKAGGVWTKKQYLDLINQVLDPETAVGITDMGLIYDVEEEGDGMVKVTMTLTSLGCPAGGQITTEIDAILRIQPHVKDVKIDVVWEPPWNPAMMNPEVKAMLFGNN